MPKLQNVDMMNNYSLL